MKSSSEIDKDYFHRLTHVVANGRHVNTLVGSFFHSFADGEIDMQGCVVAEVAPLVYLCELFEWVAGSSSEQRLFSLSDMMNWRFYDDSEWMDNAYKSREARKCGTP